jgi:hypothetical protein
MSKLKFYSTAVTSLLLYQSECWMLIKEQLRLRESAEMFLLRAVTGYRMIAYNQTKRLKNREYHISQIIKY